MFFKILIISIILVAIVMLALGVKLFFDSKAEFELHTCAFDENKNIDEELDCSACQIKEIADCTKTR